MITAEQIRNLASGTDSVRVTRHVLKRFRERGINYDDVLNVLKNGEIIEHYPDDYPYPSCLELGLSVHGIPLHVCAGIGEEMLFVITAYYPTPDIWEKDFKTRKTSYKKSIGK